MQRLSISQFDHLRSIGQRDNMPAPFPGQWPTRIAWKVKPLGGPVRSYLGKPIWQAAAAFSQALNAGHYTSAWFYEFDRKHIPIYSWRHHIGTDIHPTLFSAYHYWQSYDVAGSHLAMPLYRRRLGGLMIYCPYRALSADRKRQWASFMTNVTAYKPKMSVTEMVE